MSKRLIHWYLLSMVLLVVANPLFAQVSVHFVNSEQAPEALNCPSTKLLGTKPKPPAVGENDVLLVPSLDEISTALTTATSKPTASEEKLAPLVLPANRQFPLRIGFWGDSHAAANFFSEELIKSIGLAKEDVLPSFFAANMGRAGVRLPIQKSCLGGGWKFQYAYNSGATGIAPQNASPDFPVGLVRLQAKNTNSYLWLDARPTVDSSTKLQSIEFLLDLSGMTPQTVLGISVDNLPEEVLVTKADQPVIKIDADYPFSTVKIRLLQGTISLEGMIPHYTKIPKLYWDNLAIPGSTAKGWTTIKTPASFIPPYDVVFLEYGTNEGNNPRFDPVQYQSDLQVGLKNFRTLYPDAACVLIGPTDRGRLVKHAKKTKKNAYVSTKIDLFNYAKTHAQISDIQESEAKAIGCAFWHWQNAMGGQGSAYLWAYEKPPLMAKDLIHLTIQGYQKSARQFSNDIDLKALLNP